MKFKCKPSKNSKGIAKKLNGGVGELLQLGAFGESPFRD